MAAGLTVGDFSRATHLSVKTPRHYHQAGLLEPAAVNPDTGYRYYSAGQIPAAQVIRRLRDLEMPVADVKAVLARRTRPPQRPHRRALGPAGGRAGPSSAPTPPVLTGKPCYSNSIYFDRSRDRWTGTITVGWKPDGRRDRVTVRGRTKTEVKDKLRAKHTELAAGIRTPGQLHRRAVPEGLAGDPEHAGREHTNGLPDHGQAPGRADR